MSGAEAAPIHGDLSVPVCVDAAAVEWHPSPSGTVWRKRLHLVGGAESGQVTSIVRYEPSSSFPAHDHPEGEEILVLAGVFCDEHGDWPAGTYLLNPEGFRHAPFSREGCLLFVKLRQYAGARHHVALRTDREKWRSSAETGVETLTLYAEPEFPDSMRLERWAAETGPLTRTFPDGAELLVLRGSIEVGGRVHGPQSWLRLPVDSQLTASTLEGCEIYLKTGGLRDLRESRAD
jgi:hypothetical protein